MSWSAVLLVVYGVVNVLGGIMGFVQAQSVLSLVVGGAMGVLLIACGLATKTRPAMGFRLGGLLVAALIAFWSYRAYSVSAADKSPMIALMNLGLAVGVLATLLLAHFVAVNRSRQR